MENGVLKPLPRNICLGFLVYFAKDAGSVMESSARSIACAEKNKMRAANENQQQMKKYRK
jgi:hypothetical protein